MRRFVTPAKAGVSLGVAPGFARAIPAFAGMTGDAAIHNFQERRVSRLHEGND